ncbi:hypothetical protein [Paraclostridium dentum]|uniref:hypothetical protein n=1 Tax=Paraclostridium dentum TaxID=2662455 RepID=UPI003F32273E
MIQFSSNNLENLLAEKSSLFEEESKPAAEDNCEVPHGGTAKKMQRAKRNSSLYDFLDMTARIVDYAMKDQKVEFLTEDQENMITDPEIPVNHPYISYKVISRKPKNEYKPIVREDIVECDEHNEQRFGTVNGQFFDCIVQFNVFASENRVANEVMETFEELMISYAGYFKEQGVVDLYFKEQVTDTDYNNFRETLSVRNIRYYVQIEKLMVIFNRRISDINQFGDIKK